MRLRSTAAVLSAQQLRQLGEVRRHAAGLVAGQPVGCRAALRRSDMSGIGGEAPGGGPQPPTPRVSPKQRQSSEIGNFTLISFFKWLRTCQGPTFEGGLGKDRVASMHHLRPMCARCAYWVEDNTAFPPTAGHCHRYPPGIFINPKDGVVAQKFPTTDRHHWCGEWCGNDSRLMEGVRESAVESVQHQK